MNETFVTYEQAQALKRLGFDWECEDVYSQRLPNNAPFNKREDAVRYFQLTGYSLFIEVLYPAPRLDQAAKWLREVKGWDVTSIPTLAKYGRKMYRWDVCHWNNPEYGECSDGIFETYEQALSAGLDKALELLEIGE